MLSGQCVSGIEMWCGNANNGDCRVRTQAMDFMPQSCVYLRHQRDTMGENVIDVIGKVRGPAHALCQQELVMPFTDEARRGFV